MSDATTTIPGYAAMLDAIAAQLRDVPPAPIFASSDLFPSDGAWSFTVDRQDYVCAGPAFWARVPKALLEPPTDVVVLGAIQIIDLDNPRAAEMRGKVMTALVTVLEAAHVAEATA